MKQNFKNMSYDRALEKAMRYCVYQERCQFDIENRFIAWNVKKADGDKILDYLIDADFLNESRYVEAFVRGKFKIKKWGRYKIKMGLFNKRIFDEQLILKAFEEELEDADYQETIKELITKKAALINETDDFKKRDKLYRFLLSKGFESELVVKELKVI